MFLNQAAACNRNLHSSVHYKLARPLCVGPDVCVQSTEVHRGMGQKCYILRSGGTTQARVVSYVRPLDTCIKVTAVGCLYLVVQQLGERK